MFNGLTKSFFLVTIQNADSIKYVINHPNEYIERKEFLSLINSLSSKGFILEDNISELDCIERDYYQYINSDTYLLLILTTYNCNFNCWYCVQEHNNEFLSSETSGRIKKHIAKYLIENNIKNFQLSWFGGEPTLRPDTIVDISSFASQFCKQNSINFQNSITTNGSLLSEKLILQFALCGLNTYQITIDGKQDLHNKVRCSILDQLTTNSLKLKW